MWVDPTDSSELPDTAVRSANYPTGELISLRDLHEDEPLREIKMNLGSMSLLTWWAAASVARVLEQTRSSGGSIMQEETLDLDLGSC